MNLTLNFKSYTNNVLTNTNVNHFFAFYNNGINGEISRNFLNQTFSILNTGTFQLSNNIRTIECNVSFTDTFQIIITAPFIFPNETFNVKIGLRKTPISTWSVYNFIISNINKTIDINYDFTGDMYKPNPTFIYSPIDNMYHGFEMSNTKDITVVHKIDGIVISTSMNPIIEVLSDKVISSTYTQTKIINNVPTIVNTSTILSNIEYISNEIDFTTSITTDKVFLIKDEITENTGILESQVAAFLNNSSINTSDVITKGLISKLLIKSINTSSSQEDVRFDSLLYNPIQVITSFNNIYKGFSTDVIAEVNNYIPDGFSNSVIPTFQSYLTLKQGSYYYVNRIGNATTLQLTYNAQNMGTAIGVNEVFKVDISSILTTINTGDDVLLLANPYFEVILCTIQPQINTLYINVHKGTNSTIDGSSISRYNLVYLTNVNSTLVNVYLIPVNLKLINSYSRVLLGNKNLDILYNSNGSYDLYNMGLSTAYTEIFKLSFENESNIIETSIQTLIANSNSISNFSFPNDGVYKLVINGISYYFVSLLQIETCLYEFINKILCSTECNSSHCSLDAKTNYVSMSIIYDMIKDLIEDVIGNGSLYNTVLPSNLHKFHSIDELIVRTNKFCNCLSSC